MGGGGRSKRRRTANSEQCNHDERKHVVGRAVKTSRERSDRGGSSDSGASMGDFERQIRQALLAIPPEQQLERLQQASKYATSDDRRLQHNRDRGAVVESGEGEDDAGQV